MLEEAVKENVLVPNIDIELVLRIIEGATSTVAQWYSSSQEYSLEKQADAITAILSFGILHPDLKKTNLKKPNLNKRKCFTQFWANLTTCNHPTNSEEIL